MRKGKEDKSYVDTVDYVAVNKQRKQVDMARKSGEEKSTLYPFP